MRIESLEPDEANRAIYQGLFDMGWHVVTNHAAEKIARGSSKVVHIEKMPSGQYTTTVAIERDRRLGGNLVLAAGFEIKEAEIDFDLICKYNGLPRPQTPIDSYALSILEMYTAHFGEPSSGAIVYDPARHSISPQRQSVIHASL